MAANVESMFSVREKPWHGIGTVVMEAPSSVQALKLAGLDWDVVQEDIYTRFGGKVDGYKANLRNTDRRVLGVVSDRYKVVQNVEAFSFTDELLGKGVRYETAGSLRLRQDMMKRYYDAPDLKKVGNNAYRFINAVSDFATHAEPLRRTANYSENLFGRTIDGNPLIDKAYQLVKAA